MGEKFVWYILCMPRSRGLGLWYFIFYFFQDVIVMVSSEENYHWFNRFNWSPRLHGRC